MTPAELKEELQRREIGHIKAAHLLSKMGPPTVHPSSVLAWMKGADIPDEIAEKVLKLPFATRKPRRP
jgi:hypothetical protein